MSLRGVLLLALLAGAADVKAQEDDPQLAAALAKCPSAAKFIAAREAEEKAKHEAEPPGTTTVASDPQLRQRLLDMEKRDQDARQAVFASGGAPSQEAIQAMLAIDAENLPQIKRIVAEHDGLPRQAQAGADGVKAAWLLVQHADTDPAFQNEVLGKIQPLVDAGEIEARSYALLTDRVLVNQGKPQRYGSQLQSVDGNWAPKPIEAPEQVDQRRAEVGDMPLADYICLTTQMFSPPPAESTDEAAQETPAH